MSEKGSHGVQRLYSKKNIVYGPYAEVNYNSPYLKVSSTTKGKGLRWEDLSYWLSTVVSAC